jgi:LCP family protein required for cell wall assembly
LIHCHSAIETIIARSICESLRLTEALSRCILCATYLGFRTAQKMTGYPSLNALRNKDAKQAVAIATGERRTSVAGNPLEIKKIRRRRSRRTALKVFVVAIALFLISGTVFGARMLTVGSGVFNGDGSDGFFAQLKALFGDAQPLIGENDDRVNFLLLGKGDDSHDGALLTDTIIVASLKPSTKEAAMLSIPRDLFVNVPNFGQSKINGAYAFGEQAGTPGGGAEVARETVEEITGLDIPYYVVVDFKAFEKIVDDLGGIDVTIEEPFYDYLHAIQYDAGEEHFTGQQALYYIRGRYIEPAALAGDFHRAERTQALLARLYDKGKQLNPVSDLTKITGILSSLGDHVRTNLTPAELRRVYEIAGAISIDQIRSRVIDDGETGLVYGNSIPVGGINMSVLSPNDPTFGEIQAFAAAMFEAEPPAAENATLEIQNGTETVGVASSFSESFSELEVLSVTNADDSDYDETFIVDNSDGKVPQSLALLLEALAKVGLEPRVLSAARYPNQSSADLILILGADYADTLETE